MKTKLVYVLTSMPDATYIEQALMSVYTARYHNPNAYIVLLVDDLTDKLLVGKRAEILDYISEKKVVSFDDVNLNAGFRSRLVKTNVRNLVDGDYLFIDCDTIITGSLEEIDDCPYEVGAVLDGLMPIAEYHIDMQNNIINRANILEIDVSAEIKYFSSGVMYVKNTEHAHRLYSLWHQYWKEYTHAIHIDQPTLLKADIELGHLIKEIDKKWNGVMFTQIPELQQGLILHFAQTYLASYLFGKRFCGLLRENGLKGNAFYEWAVLHPHCTYIPFDNYFYYYKFGDIPRVAHQLTQMASDYAKYIDSNFEDVKKLPGGLYPPVYNLLLKGHYRLAAWLLTLLKWRKTHSKKFVPKNYCSKN